MWAIATQQDVAFFKDNRSVVSVYLSKGYDAENTRWILDAWAGFNHDSGHNWHLLIPCRSGAFELNEQTVRREHATKKVVDKLIDPDLYNVEEARKIITANKLDDEKFPLLLFENFDPDGSPFFLSLRDLKRSEMTEFLEDVAKLIERETELGPLDNANFRKRCHEEIQMLARKKWAGRIGIKALGVGATVLGLAFGAIPFI
jgi:hypothetical protein